MSLRPVGVPASCRLMRFLRAVHPLVWAWVFLAAVLLPLCDKALHIDDPLFAWTAQRIEHDPLDFFGFQVNWWGTAIPMTDAMFNPPTASYYIALVALSFGWHEVALHLAFLLPALGAATGIYYLAKKWCRRPLVATLLAIATPVYLVSATTLMCDMPMLMFWVWAIILWEKGVEGKGCVLAVAGVVAGMAILTKYTAILLLLVLALDTVLRRRAWTKSVVALLVAVAMVAAYEFATSRLYGRGLISLASDYAAARRASASRDYQYQAIAGLAFLGGGLAGPAFCAALLWSRRVLFIGGGIAFLVAAAASSMRETLGSAPVSVGNHLNWPLLFQVGFWAAVGVSILALTLTGWWRSRDPVNTLLAVWIAAGVLFAVVVNWTVSGRSLLIIVPAVAILVARELERPELASTPPWKLWVPMALAALLGICVAAADYRLANSARKAAAGILARYRPSDDRPLWFQGHWGFQYYMQASGGVAVDFARGGPKTGDLVITPYNNTTIRLLPSDWVSQTQLLQLRPCRWVTTMHPDSGAGFYASQLGPLPFFFGPVPAEVYYIQQLTRPIPPADL